MQRLIILIPSVTLLTIIIPMLASTVEALNASGQVFG